MRGGERMRGGEIEIRPVRSLSEAGQAAPVVVNCSGLGARELAGDRDLRPVFGQHVVLANPGLETLFMELSQAMEWTSIFPHSGRVVCGGIRLPGRWDTAVDPGVSQRILRRCSSIEPRLRDAEIIEIVTGLRPVPPRRRSFGGNSSAYSVCSVVLQRVQAPCPRPQPFVWFVWFVDELLRQRRRTSVDAFGSR